MVMSFQSFFRINSHFSTNGAFLALAAADAAFAATVSRILLEAATRCGDETAACLSGTETLVKKYHSATVAAGNLGGRQNEDWNFIK